MQGTGPMGGHSTLWLVLLLCAAHASHGQIQSLRAKRQQPTNMPMITGLDVTCEKTGMTVNLQFSAPFNGVVFSKGHFSNPACRYVEPGGGRSGYVFTVDTGGCGTQLADGRGGEISSAENIIIVQMDPLVQEIWDSARRISCQWEDTYRKSISFQPFSVGMLAVEQGEDTSHVDCWMDIRKGAFPQTRPLEGVTKIGEPLSILIFLSDKGEGRFDVKAQDCWAYDSPYFEVAATTKVQLTTLQGCPVKKKLIGQWEKTREVPRTGVTRDRKADLILYNIVNAFKFPDNAQVYITCNVEICRGVCDNSCSSTTTSQTTQGTPRPFFPTEPRKPKALTVSFTPTPRSVDSPLKEGIQEDATPKTIFLSNPQSPSTRRPVTSSSLPHVQHTQLTLRPPIKPHAQLLFQQVPVQLISETKFQPPIQVGPQLPTFLQQKPQKKTKPQLPTQIQARPTQHFKPHSTINLHPQPSTNIQPQPSTQFQFQPLNQFKPQPSAEFQPKPLKEVQPQPVTQFQPKLPNQFQPMPPAQFQPPNLLQPQSPSKLQPKPLTQFQSQPLTKFQPQQLTKFQQKSPTQFDSVTQPIPTNQVPHNLSRLPTSSNGPFSVSPLSTPQPSSTFFGPFPPKSSSPLSLRPSSTFAPQSNVPTSNPPTFFQFSPSLQTANPTLLPPFQQNSPNSPATSPSHPNLHIPSLLPPSRVNVSSNRRPRPFRPSPELPWAMFQPVVPMQQAIDPSHCFPGAINARCNLLEACRREPKNPDCKSYARCRRLQMQQDCSAIACRISPLSTECNRHPPKLVSTAFHLPKHARPCDPSKPGCKMSNIFSRPQHKFKMNTGDLKIIPSHLKKQNPKDNQISFCEDGTLDQKCKPTKAFPPTLQKPQQSLTPAQTSTSKPSPGAEMLTTAGAVTRPPVKPSHMPTRSHLLHNTNGISNGPLNFHNPPLSASPIKNNIIIQPHFKTGTHGNNNPLTRQPKQLDNGTNNPIIQPSVSIQILCHQGTAGTNAEGSVLCQDDLGGPAGDQTTIFGIASPAGNSGVPIDTDTPSAGAGHTTPRSGLQDLWPTLMTIRPISQPTSKTQEPILQALTHPAFIGPNSIPLGPDHKFGNTQFDFDLPKGTVENSDPIPQAKSPGFESSRLMLEDPGNKDQNKQDQRSEDPSSKVPLDDDPLIKDPSIASPSTEKPDSGNLTPNVPAEKPAKKQQPGNEEAEQFSDTGCQGRRCLPLPAADPIKIDSHDCPPGALQQDCTSGRGSGLMRTPGDPQFLGNPGTGHDSKVPEPTPEEGREGPVGPSSLPTLSFDPSKANQAGMLNGPNQEGAGIPEIGPGTDGTPGVVVPALVSGATPHAGQEGCGHGADCKHLDRQPKARDQHPEDQGNCPPGPLEKRCQTEKKCDGQGANCWPFLFSRDVARQCLADSSTRECQAFALAYERYCASTPGSPLCSVQRPPGLQPAPSRPGSQPRIECSTQGHHHHSPDPICRFLTLPGLTGPQPDELPHNHDPNQEQPLNLEPRDPRKKAGEVPAKKERQKSGPLVKTQETRDKIMNPNKSRKPSLRPSSKRPDITSRRPIQQLAPVTRRPGARHNTQMDLSNEDPSEETSLKPQPFLAFSKPGSFLDSPSTTSQPQPSPQPRRRQPKQQQDDEEEEASEPKAEPEAGHHGKGNPRTHAFHSWLYQKIDPKVRAARRKKFFGSGRRRREVTKEVQLQESSEQEEGGEAGTLRAGRQEESRHHAFHSWLHQSLDPVARQARRQKLWQQRHSRLPPLPSPRHQQDQDQTPTKTRREAREAAGISINLGVKRIVIEDTLGDMLTVGHREDPEPKWSRQQQQQQQQQQQTGAGPATPVLGVWLVLAALTISLVMTLVWRRKCS